MRRRQQNCTRVMLHAVAGRAGERAERQGPYAHRVSGPTLQSGVSRVRSMVGCHALLGDSASVLSFSGSVCHTDRYGQLHMACAQADGIFGRVQSALAAGQDARTYNFCRELTAAALNEVNEKALWARYGL